ncbi:hypothetical protein PsAD46_01029 [Pseudovibrio sp. Ad46]|uniref:hypothetical protein n=1 Tax=unclassified Pseudovibrio TaxID=2627060 RepID=UPI0007AE68E9|nr:MULTISPECIES: hypothetical protein [unclassified Pseudovibrio]KZK94438.1 hypothetical protein PsAD46_01029 [Pseudovibrio sp. Ad46]KZK95171.1 hypothetical protein PsAD5_02893 [Pseudovibrio sp. Ad5]
MVYPLAEQRMAAELINPRQDEAVVMDMELFAQAVVDSHQSLGVTTGGALDLASLPVLLRDMKGGQTLLKEIGLQGRYYTKVVNGKTYVVFKGYSALRETLKGTRYLSTSPKVIAFGIGPEALKSAGRSNAIIMITCYVALDVMQFVMSDEQLYHELFANIITDVAIGTVAMAAGALAAAGAVAIAGTITAIALPAVVVTGGAIIVGLYVGHKLSELSESYQIKKKLGAALLWTGQAVAHGVQEVGKVIHAAHVAMKQKVEEFERRSNRFMNQLERETIWHFGGPDLYNQLYRRH